MRAGVYLTHIHIEIQKEPESFIGSGCMGSWEVYALGLFCYGPAWLPPRSLLSVMGDCRAHRRRLGGFKRALCLKGRLKRSRSPGLPLPPVYFDPTASNEDSPELSCSGVWVLRIFLFMEPLAVLSATMRRQTRQESREHSTRVCFGLLWKFPTTRDAYYGPKAKGFLF